ncbi:hypothetical protein KVR01_007329 [Diaporthe batatas]|uniref:uncharacterized protein n=1 Tax=Diaporthe batatas TaxID=748121 RepID=UPI001D04EF3F|nr:uncharacterized protein KVR01_007329 [Diaporthe batatas]KAG8162851.1 hypothetical protein KVR01_007329 [Diaporthe batatas]
MPPPNPDTVAVFTKPGHPKFVASMFSRLFGTLFGVLAFPSGVWRKLPEFAIYDDTLRAGPMSANKKEWLMNMKARKFLEYAKTFTPQVLFRGFTPDSGGGEDERLNGPHGVVPHGFLDGTIPTSMWRTLHLSAMISGHLEGDENIVSDFSSWTQTWMTALRFSRYPHNKEARIAVLDTSSIEEHVWSSCDLLRADLTEDEYPDEYLIYGPITGPKYHYVSPYELYNKTRIRDLLGSAPSVFGENPDSLAIEQDAVESAKAVAAFLQPRSGRGETLAVLTARFVSYRAARITQNDSDRRQYLSYKDIEKYLSCVESQIDHLAKNARDGEVVLVDATMYAGKRYLRFEVQLLQAVENAVRIRAHELRSTM